MSLWQSYGKVWNKRKGKYRSEPDPQSIRASSPGVIITIAREHGTAGKQIGQLVAQKLDIPCYYKEMTAIAAKESGLASEFISNINSDENAVMRELYLSTNVIQQSIIAQDKVIKMIAEAGSCVIIGRSADHVLRHKKDLVRIFIYAPKEYRTKKLWKCMAIHGTRGKGILNALIWRGQLITRIYLGKNGATHINMNFALTVLLVFRNVLMSSLSMY